MLDQEASQVGRHLVSGQNSLYENLINYSVFYFQVSAGYNDHPSNCGLGLRITYYLLVILHNVCYCLNVRKNITA